MAKIARPMGTRPAKWMGQVWVLKTQPVASSGYIKKIKKNPNYKY